MILSLPMGEQMEALRNELISPKMAKLVAGWLLETMVTG